MIGMGNIFWISILYSLSPKKKNILELINLYAWLAKK